MIRPVLTVRKMFVRRLNLLLLLCLLLLLVGGNIILYRQAFTTPPAAEPTVLEVISRKAAAAVCSTYGLTIKESGPGYELCFTGIAEGERLFGEIEGYDLEVYACRGQFYVKNKEATAWQPAAAAELDALPVLLRDPHQLLATMLTAGELQAETGQKRTVDNVLCQTYVLELDTPDAGLVTRFANEATLEKLKLYLWFAEEGGFLHRMAMAMDINVAGEAVQISRMYVFSPEGGGLPDGLPPAEGYTYPL
ncbi:MAG TPA: hypothetical protein GX699_06980 [Firmicutes bacterium]|nr:hypothetical protein [Bacillota bacterium]